MKTQKSKQALTMIIGLFFAFLIFLSSPTLLAEAQSHRLEDKIYSNVTIDKDFDPSCVLVVMDKYTGGINKKHEYSFFGNLNIKSIKDLTYITGDIITKELLDFENFRQILEIELEEKSKENVIVKGT